MRATFTLTLILLLLTIGLIVQAGDDVHLPLMVSAQNDTTAPASMLKGYVKSCETTHRYTRVTVNSDSLGYDKVVYSDRPDGLPIRSSSKYANVLQISATGPVGGDWWVWLVDENENRLSEAVSVQTHGEPGLGRCQEVHLIFYSTAPSPLPDGTTIVKGGYVEPRSNPNQVITFFGLLCNEVCPSGSAVGGYRLVVEGPHGRSESTFGSTMLHGDPGLPSEFVYNGKLEIPGAPPGEYSAHVADHTGTRLSEAWVYIAQDDIRTFLPRWIQRQADPSTDPCADIGGDGCKFKVTGGPKAANNGGAELKLQLFFINSAVDGGQPQGSYYIALEKNGQRLPVPDSIRSIALQRSEGPLGPYNYEYSIPLDALPDGTVAGSYVGWVLDGNGVRDSQNFSFNLSVDQGLLWIQFDQATR